MGEPRQRVRQRAGSWERVWSKTNKIRWPTKCENKEEGSRCDSVTYGWALGQERAKIQPQSLKPHETPFCITGCFFLLILHMLSQLVYVCLSCICLMFPTRNSLKEGDISSTSSIDPQECEWLIRWLMVMFMDDCAVITRLKKTKSQADFRGG